MIESISRKKMKIKPLFLESSFVTLWGYVEDTQCEFWRAVGSRARISTACRSSHLPFVTRVVVFSAPYLEMGAPGVGATAAGEKTAARFEAPIGCICTVLPARAFSPERLGRDILLPREAAVRPERDMAAIVRCEPRGGLRQRRCGV